MIAARQIFLGRGGAKLPYDAEVEYLESTGTQWIDTLVNADSNLSVETTMANVGTPWNNVNPGGIILATPRRRHHLNFAVQGVRYFLGVGDSCDLNSNVMPSDGDVFTYKVDAVNKTFTIGSFLGTFPNDTFDTGLSYWLFGRNGTTPPYLGSLRIYSAKLWNGSTLVRDFIPVRIGTEGAMYDRVSGQLFRNQGTGAFTYGGDVYSVPVETSQYVQDGLVAMWDGKENAGVGKHSEGKTCKNIVSDLYNGTVGADVEIGSDYFGFDGVRNISHVISLGDSWFGRPENITCEICFVSTGDGSQTTQCCFGGSESRTSGISFVCGTSDSYIHCMTSAYTGSFPSFSSGGSWIKEPARTISFSVGNGINSYLNGQNVYSLSGTYTMDWQQQIYPCYIGSDAYNPTEFTLCGKVFCVRFYNCSLTAAEIAANYAVDKRRFNLP